MRRITASLTENAPVVSAVLITIVVCALAAWVLRAWEISNQRSAICRILYEDTVRSDRELDNPASLTRQILPDLTPAQIAAGHRLNQDRRDDLGCPP